MKRYAKTGQKTLSEILPSLEKIANKLGLRLNRLAEFKRALNIYNLQNN